MEIKTMKCPTGHITLTELGRLLRVSARQIRYAHDAGFLPEPPRVKGRRAYDLGWVIRVAEYFGKTYMKN